nr:hypothetical protein [Cressdnaviricota sp.]
MHVRGRKADYSSSAASSDSCDGCFCRWVPPYAEGQIILYNSVQPLVVISRCLFSLIQPSGA